MDLLRLGLERGESALAALKAALRKMVVEQKKHGDSTPTIIVCL
jgi:hypothetical protein